MKCRFSEKFYEILFDNELINLSSKPFVYIPSQHVEKDVGYDAIFAGASKKAMFIQFKIPYTHNVKKKEFRFKIYKSKKHGFDQHNKLCDYNASGKKVIALYYSPLFSTFADLLAYYKANDIIRNSKLFIPLSVNKIKGKSALLTHYVKYDRTNAKMFCDDGIEIESKPFEELIQSLEPLTLEKFKEEIKDLKLDSNVQGFFVFFNC